MTWAVGRRFVVFLIITAILAVFAAIAYFFLFYRAPSCSDGMQNQDEEGVDCGGACAYLCTAALEPPTVLFTKAVLNGEGRTDVISLVENKNQEAGAKDVPYAITVYGYDQMLIQRITGMLDLPPGASVPVFVPGIASGRQTPGTSFLAIEPNDVRWHALAEDPRIVPSVSNTVLGGSDDAPRITATLTNPDVVPMKNVRVIVIVRDGAGNTIAGSQTLLPSIPSQGSATATFTWNAAFAGVPVQIQVLPVIPLP